VNVEMESLEMRIFSLRFCHDAGLGVSSIRSNQELFSTFFTADLWGQSSHGNICNFVRLFFLVLSAKNTKIDLIIR